MKRCFSLLLLFCLTLTAFVPRANAYDYRTDNLESAELPAVEEILEQAAGLGNVPIDPAELTLEVDQAVRVYRYTPEDFLAALEGGLGEELKTHDWTVWKVPISGTDTCRYAVLRNGEFTTCYSTMSPLSLRFLYAPAKMDEALSGRSGDVYITNIPTWGITLVVHLDGDAVELMPLADSPDRFGVENWQWYTVEEMTELLHAYGVETGAVSTGPNYAIPIAVTLLLVAFVVLFFAIKPNMRTPRR